MKTNIVENKVYALLFCSIFVMGTLTSCLSMLEIMAGSDTPTTPRTQSTPRNSWSFGYFTDQFGDRTGDLYMEYNGEIDGVFSNSGGYRNEPTKFNGLTFSEQEGLTFHASEVFAAFGVVNVLFNIKFLDETTLEFNGRGLRDSRNNRYMFHIPYSDSLLTALMQENITMRFATSTAQCQFEFPLQFKDAYESLQSRQNESSDNTTLRWSLGAFTDRWGDKTGDYFVQYDGEIDTIYTTANSDRSETITLTELRFSKQEGLRFIFSRGVLANIVGGDALFSIILPDQTTVEFDGRGTNGIFVVPYSDDLLDALLYENVIVAFITRSSVRAQCQFKLPPRFKDAYGLL